MSKNHVTEGVVSLGGIASVIKTLKKATTI